jgi:hypothetical protein
MAQVLAPVQAAMAQALALAPVLAATAPALAAMAPALAAMARALRPMAQAHPAHPMKTAKALAMAPALH